MDLLLGRRILLNDLDRVIERFKRQGNNNLYALQKLLKKKRDYSKLAGTLQVTKAYLVVLNREVNSYVSKSPDLAKLNIFKDSEIGNLKEQKILNSKGIYQKLQSKASREKISETTKIPLKKLETALQTVDLLRINGVGPVFTRLLLEIGIRNVHELLEKPAHILLDSYQRLNEEKGQSLPNLGLKDINYCQRFAGKLDQDIEW